MMTYLKIALFSSVLALIACNSTESKKRTPKQSTKSDQLERAAQQSPEPLRIKDDNLQAVYQQYLKLSRALIDGDATRAKLASIALEAGARLIPGGSPLAAAAADVTTASTLEKQRAYFSVISNEMVTLVKRSGLNSGEIYVDYCPMALNDKGAYWLSSQKDIENPYFGVDMLSCGEVKDTIQ